MGLAAVRAADYLPTMPDTASMPLPVKDQLWTAEQFLDWLTPGKKAELIDGEKHMHSPVNLKHARLLNFIHLLLSLHVERHKLGEVHREVVAVRLSARSVFMPDIGFFTREQVTRLNPAFAPFAPTLVIEALSPSSEKRDKKLKFAKYEEHGVQEYWILDPEHLRHQFYRREGDLLVEFDQGAEHIASHSVKGFWVKRAWLNPEQLPEVRRCFSELMGKT